MHLLSYEQDLKSLKLKRAGIDAKFAKGMVQETGRKFRPCVGCSDKHIKLQQRLVFEVAL